MKTTILVNPNARAGAVGQKWPDLQAHVLGALGEGEARIEFTTAEDHGAAAVRRALKDGAERIVVVGGDGTVSEAVQGFFEQGQLIAPEAILAVMPAGRGDDFFKVLAGGRCSSTEQAWAQGLEVLRRGRPEPADLGRITWLAGDGAALPGMRAFINIASFGYPGLVVHRVASRAGALGRTRLGKSGWAYLVQIATGMAQYKPIETEIRVDGEKVFDGPLFSGFVLNGYYNAGGMRWSDEARIDDGIFNVVLSEPRNPVATALTGPRMLSGNWRGVRGIHLFPGKRVEIRTREAGERGFPLFEIDGEQPEPAGVRGAAIEVLPSVIRVWR
jgi:diacylglycerol kinase family enzyme